jgi:hypothetical protein
MEDDAAREAREKRLLEKQQARALARAAQSAKVAPEPSAASR